MKKGTKIVVGIVGAVFAFLFFKILFELVTVTLKKNALLKDIQTLKQDISKGELRKQTIYNDAGL